MNQCPYCLGVAGRKGLPLNIDSFTQSGLCGLNLTCSKSCTAQLGQSLSKIGVAGIHNPAKYFDRLLKNGHCLVWIVPEKSISPSHQSYCIITVLFSYCFSKNIQ